MLGSRGFAYDGAGLASRFGDGAACGFTVSPSGGLAQVRDAALVRQAIMLLLTTVPGERVMRPEYGCPLDRLIFAPNDATTAGLAIHYVRRAVTRWEKRVEIVRLDAGQDINDPGVLAIRLDYRLRDSGVEDSVSLGVTLDGGVG